MKNRKNVTKLLLFLGIYSASIAVTLTSCSRESSPGNTTTTTNTMGSVGQTVDDKTLTANVKMALNNNPDYKFDGVTVTTMNSTVQLGGFVNTDDQKSKAADIAKGVQGVKDVENKISTKPAQ